MNVIELFSINAGSGGSPPPQTANPIPLRIHLSTKLWNPASYFYFQLILLYLILCILEKLWSFGDITEERKRVAEYHEPTSKFAKDSS